MSVLDGRVAIVTGASRCIGAEIALRFGQAGAAVAAAARTTEAGMSPAAPSRGLTGRVTYSQDLLAELHAAP